MKNLHHGSICKQAYIFAVKNKYNTLEHVGDHLNSCSDNKSKRSHLEEKQEKKYVADKWNSRLNQWETADSANKRQKVYKSKQKHMREVPKD